MKLNNHSSGSGGSNSLSNSVVPVEVDPLDLDTRGGPPPGIDIVQIVHSPTPHLHLKSPYSTLPITYNWPLFTETGREGMDGAAEIYESIRLLTTAYPTLDSVDVLPSPRSYDPTCFESMSRLCSKFNRMVEDAIRAQRADFRVLPRGPPSPALLKHIISQTYNAVVTSPKSLNGYIPFSPNVYGETSFDLVAQMIDQLEIGPDDIFIDLGSGVGQVVLQMAAGTRCKMCYGIEKADIPAKYAEQMSLKFRELMTWYGQSHGEYKIVKGDFLDAVHQNLIKESTIIFVNNYAFGPKVDHELKLKFADLKDGVRIVSSKAFCPLNFRITDRNLSDIAAIMHIRELLTPMKGSVSWTDKPVSYYLHVIDSTILARYFENKLNRETSGGSGNNTKSRRRRNHRGQSITNDNPNTIVETSSSSSSTSSTDIMNQSESNPFGNSDNENNNPNSNSCLSNGGPTTRRAWSDWCEKSAGRGGGKSDLDETDAGENGISSSSKKLSTQNLPGNQQKKLVKKSPGPRTNGTQSAGPKTSRPKSRRTASFKRRQLKKKKVPPKLINGLELLHTSTVLSTTTGTAHRPPPAPGCIDTHLTILTFAHSHNKHQELSIPATHDTPYALQKLLDIYRAQYLELVETMKKPEFKQQLLDQVEFQTSKKEYLMKRRELLECGIKELTKSSVDLLREKLRELGIDMGEGEENGGGADRLLSEARSIVLHHKSLQSTAQKVQSEINTLESTVNVKVQSISQQILENYRNRPGTSNNLNYNDPVVVESIVRSEIINELRGVLARRDELEKKCREDQARIEEFENLNKKLIASGATPTNPNSPCIKQARVEPEIHQAKGKTYQRSTSNPRSQDSTNLWPSIPPIPKINENNPEVLARKILETGRKIEQRMSSQTSFHPPQTSPKGVKPSPTTPPSTGSVGGRKTWNSKFATHEPQQQSPPKVSFFEDGVKNIIENLLNEGNPNPNAGANKYQQPQQQQTQQQLRTSTSPKQQMKSTTPGRLALKMHFEKTTASCSSNNSTPTSTSSCDKQQHQQSQPLTIQDLVSGEIERSLNHHHQHRSTPTNLTVPNNYPSPPVTDIYRPIEQTEKSQSQPTNYNRASVLVTNKTTVAEGLHARMMNAMNSNKNEPENLVTAASTTTSVEFIKKETKVFDDKVGGGNGIKIKTTQVVIGGGGVEPNDCSNSNSVLRVVKKRILNDDDADSSISTTTGSPRPATPNIQPPPKKKALSLLSSLNEQHHHPPPTPSPKLLIVQKCHTPTTTSSTSNGNSEIENDFNNSTDPRPSSSTSASAAPTISQWQSQVSSNFEKLFCFANEINDKKRRKSLETASIIKIEQLEDDEDSPKSPNCAHSSMPSSSHHYPRPPRTPSPSHAHEIDDELDLSLAMTPPIKSECQLPNTTTIDIDPLGLASNLLGLDEPPPTPTIPTGGGGINTDDEEPCGVVKIKIEKTDEVDDDNCSGAQSVHTPVPDSCHQPAPHPPSSTSEEKQQHFKKRWNNWGGSSTSQQSQQPQRSSSVSSDCSSNSATPQPNLNHSDYHHNHINPMLPKFRGKQSSWGDSWPHEPSPQQQPIVQHTTAPNNPSNTASPLPLIQVNVTLTHPIPQPPQMESQPSQQQQQLDPHGPFTGTTGAKININTNQPQAGVHYNSHPQQQHYRTTSNNYHQQHTTTNNYNPNPRHQQQYRYHPYNNSYTNVQMQQEQEMRNSGSYVNHGHPNHVPQTPHGYYPHPHPQQQQQHYPQKYHPHPQYHQQQQHHPQQRR